jgi:hypothetical protein
MLDHANVAQSSLEGMIASLFALWNEINNTGNLGPIAVPLIGQGHSRLNSLTPDASLRLTALPFVLRSNQSRVSSKLVIVFSKEGEETVDLRKFARFLRELPGAKRKA